MSDLSNFESRTGKLNCSDQELFHFVTDLRNFERFILQGTFGNWQADRESCSFSVPVPGKVSIRLVEKENYVRVVYTGDALKKNDFTLVLNITGKGNSLTEVKVSLSADLNPMLKMMAAKPLGQFLEILISEMEKFEEWKDLKE
jgi:hypothetical protein